MERLSEIAKIDVGLEAQSLNGNTTGEYFDMEKYRKGLFILQGNALGEEETVKIEALQAKDADGTSSKALKDLDDNAIDATITAQTNVTEATIGLGSVANTDTVTVNGKTYTKAAATSVSDQEFADDDGLASCINDDDVGVDGVEASASSDTVTVKAEDPGEKTLTISAVENSGTVALATVSALAYIDFRTELLDTENDFSHVACKVTTGAAQDVAVDLLRAGARYTPDQKVAASSTK